MKAERLEDWPSICETQLSFKSGEKD